MEEAISGLVENVTDMPQGKQVEFGFTGYMFSKEPDLYAIRDGPKVKKKNPVSDAFFYFLILAAVLIAFLVSSGASGPRDFFGYSYFTILTKSMHSVMPKGSIVITKKVDSSEIQKGDDITYFKSDKSTVTHRVIEVFENYEESGMRGFKTKGVDNNTPDREIVYANNVVGKVVFFSPRLGALLKFIRENIWLVGGMVATLLITFISLQWLIKTRKEAKAEEKEDIPSDP